jgi:hypothetical protein
MKKLFISVIFLLTTCAFAMDAEVYSGVLTPSDFSAVNYGARVSQPFPVPGHKGEVFAGFDTYDISDAADFLPDSLTKAEAGVKVVGREYVLDAKLITASDKPFEDSGNVFGNIYAAKKFYEKGNHSVRAGFFASGHSIGSFGYIIPAVSYTYANQDLRMSAGLLNKIDWSATEQFSLAAEISFLGSGSVSGTYSLSDTLSFTLKAEKAGETYYPVDKYEDETEINLRITSVTLSAEKKLTSYALVTVYAGAVIGGIYETINDDEVIDNEKIESGAIGGAKLKIIF